MSTNTMTGDDWVNGLMIVAAHRYCLGRASYIVAVCIGWLNENWSNIHESNRQIILRDTAEALLGNRAGHDMDRRDWLRFFTEKFAGESSAVQDYITSQVSHLDELLPPQTDGHGDGDMDQ